MATLSSKRESKRTRKRSCMLYGELFPHGMASTPRLKNTTSLVVNETRTDRDTPRPPGSRTWPLPFRACLDELQHIRVLICTSRDTTPRLPMTASEQDLDTRGMTALVDSANELLNYLPTTVWRSTDDKGNMRSIEQWNLHIQQTHTPTELLEHLLLLRSMSWPSSADKEQRNGQSSAAAGECFQDGELCPELLCFVCMQGVNVANTAAPGHQNVEGRHMCAVCHRRLADVVWEEDDELLDVQCGGCGFESTEAYRHHGCRVCGSSLCECCLYKFSGDTGLRQARVQKYEPWCPVCGETIEEESEAQGEGGGAGQKERRLCFGGAKEATETSERDDSQKPADIARYTQCTDCWSWYHTLCGGLTTTLCLSAVWSCPECVAGSPAQTPAWSMRGCVLCATGATSSLKSCPRIWNRESTYPSPCGGGPGATRTRAQFNQKREIAKMNERIGTFNQQLSAGNRELDAGALAELWRASQSNGGHTVLDLCAGKGTFLGVLLRLGVPVRKYICAEINEEASKVMAVLYGSPKLWKPGLLSPGALVMAGDVRELSVKNVLKHAAGLPVTVIFMGSPCSDISKCNRRGAGINGPQSSIFFDCVNLVRSLRLSNPDGLDPVLISENVVPANPSDLTKMTEALGLPGLVSQAAIWEAAVRERVLWTNVRQEPIAEDTTGKLLQSVLRGNAFARRDKAGCIVTGRISGSKVSIASAEDHSRRACGRHLVQCGPHSTQTRGLMVEEMLRCLGQPDWEVDNVHSERVRSELVGRSISCAQIGHALGCFLRAKPLEA